jgi:transcriptional regulator with XRE-family HTH domain
MLSPTAGMRSKLEDLLYQEDRNLPNRFTEALGQRIRQAREEAKLSQAQLAERAYLKQSSVSKIETGVRAVSAEDLLYLSYALDKPIAYFFPKEFTYEAGPDEMAALEEELLLQARRLGKRDLQQLIAQARAIADFRPPKDQGKELTREQVQEVVDLLGLKPEKKRTPSSKKTSRSRKK